MDGDYRETELGLRGDRVDVEAAAAWLDAALDREGFPRASDESGA